MGRARTPVRADSWGPRTAGRGPPALPERRSIAIPGACPDVSGPALPKTSAAALKNCAANRVRVGQPNGEVACPVVALCEG